MILVIKSSHYYEPTGNIRCPICSKHCIDRIAHCVEILPTKYKYMCGDKVLYRKRNLRKPLLIAPFDSCRADMKACGVRTRICRMCGAILPKGRSAWCSNACVDKYMLQINWGMLKQHIFLRDKGICCDCCKEVEHTYNLSYHLNREPLVLRNGKMLWREKSEIHHIIPVSRGGAMWDTDNLITLCHACHVRRHKELSCNLHD